MSTQPPAREASDRDFSLETSFEARCEFVSRMAQEELDVSLSLVKKLTEYRRAINRLEKEQAKLEEQRDGLVQTCSRLENQIKQSEMPDLTDLDIELLFACKGGVQKVSNL